MQAEEDRGDGTHDDLILARLWPSGPRRVIGAVILLSLGVFVLYLALWEPPSSISLRLFLLVFGAIVIFGCLRLWQSTEAGLELTARELREAGGRRLALVSEMQSASRGPFAFKPSNGFMVVLDRSGPAAWAPGLWWRVGRRIGVGGVTSSNEARFMAEAINDLIVARGQSQGD
ncbi:MAG: hypothetical protein ACK4RN_01235 [Pseudorhodobacter sp.]